MGLKFKNNAFGTLASGITNVATSIPLGAGQGARFPVLAAGDYFYGTLVDAAVNIEVVKVTARATDTLTVVRGQDGTAGRAYLAGDRLELRPCNVALLALGQEAVDFIAAAGSGTYTATLDPIPTGYNTNQVYTVFFASANTAAAPTLNLNSLGAKVIKHLGGGTLAVGDIPAGLYALLEYNGTDFILLNPWTQADLFVAAGTDTYTVTLAPVPLAYRTDQAYQITFTNANTSATPTLNVNGLGAKNIKLPDGASLAAGYISAGMTGVLQYDGTNFRLLNPAPQLIADRIAASVTTNFPYYVPTGGVVDFAGTVAPTGWLACDGAAVSRTTYAALFTAIGTAWGVGDGSTTFNVPNLARRTTVGSGGTSTGTLGNVVGNVGGAETHTLVLAETPAHTHGGATYVAFNTPAPVVGSGNTGGGGSSAYTTSSAGGDLPHNNMQPSAVMLKIIKA